MCEMPTCYHLEKPVARKEHQCCECRGAIAIGEKYFKHCGVWDGCGCTFKVCADCEALRAEVDRGKKWGDEELTAYQHLYEAVFEDCMQQWVGQFMAIKRRRNAAIPEWMERRVP